jgi:Fe-S cluster biosynthesis and repair protein YggX
MTRKIYCAKLKNDGEKLKFAPIPGTFGKKIFDNICQEAWQQWLAHQTILINEYRLNMLDKESRAFLTLEMDKFLFGSGAEKPEQFREE